MAGSGYRKVLRMLFVLCLVTSVTATMWTKVCIDRGNEPWVFVFAAVFFAVLAIFVRLRLRRTKGEKDDEYASSGGRGALLALMMVVNILAITVALLVGIEAFGGGVLWWHYPTALIVAFVLEETDLLDALGG